MDNDNTPEIKDIPRIRDNPQMAATTAKRRSSVAHPQSIKYRDPGVSLEDTSSDDDDDEDEDDDSAHPTHANDPSISDLNEVATTARLNPHHRPIHALHDGDEADDNDDQDGEHDPFAMLGNKQESVAHPLISRFVQEPSATGDVSASGSNPYSPQNQLPARHLQQRHTHNRNHSKHSRSQTTAFGLNNAAPRPKSTRRHHSSSMDWSEQMLEAPAGPDLTFIGMRVENRSVLQSSLSPQQYAHLLDVFRSTLNAALQQFRGYSVEQHSENVYDAFVVFADVYNAVRCAIHVQTVLHAYQWPPFYYALERQSQRMAYIGTGAKDAFNGLRVGMSLHTATAGADVNKYDGGRETLSVSTLIFDTSYTGTAVELCKHLCLKSCGGELLCTKALYQALLQCKKLGDEVSVQRLGVCHVDGVRQVELIELIPRDLPAREFPPRSYVNRRKSMLAAMIVGDDTKESSPISPNYDPFPSTSAKNARNANSKTRIADIAEEEEEHDEDDDTDELETETDGTMNERHSGDGMDEVSLHSHSSKDHEVQHHPRISQRRPSLTVINLKQNSKIEVTFNGGEDDDEVPLYDDDTDRHRQPPYSNGGSSSQRVPPPTSSDAHLLNVATQHQNGGGGESDMHSDHSIDPPKQHTTRNKTQEIKRRKSLATNDYDLSQHLSLAGSSPEATPQLASHQVHDDDTQLYKKAQRRKRNQKKKKQKLRKQRSNKPDDRDANGNGAAAGMGRNGHFGDDETTPLPGDSDFEAQTPSQLQLRHHNQRIQKPKRAPRVDKKRQYKETLVNIEYDAAADDASSVYSAGSRSLRTSRTGKSERMLHAHQQLRLYKVRPPSLPEDYSDDKEFTCLCCQSIKFWVDGVWRVPMWPSFDVCVACASKELQSGTSKKRINYDPTGVLQIDVPTVGGVGSSAMLPSAGGFQAHQRVPSNQPLRNHSEEMPSLTPKQMQHSTRLDEDTVELIRKELSSMIEKLTNEKMQRLDNLIKWAEHDAEFDDWRRDRVAERKTTEDELGAWRKKAHRLDEQEQRMLRRKNTASQVESPTASDLGSDEELQSNWQDYEIQEDFSSIAHRLNELDGLFWSEDQFFKTKFESMAKRSQQRLAELEGTYMQTTMHLQTANQALEARIQDMLQSGEAAPKSDYNNLLHNNVDIDEYSSDDLNNEQMGAYDKYVPPRVRHIHESSRMLPGVAAAATREEDDPFASDGEDHGNVAADATDERDEVPVQRYKAKIQELDSTIDNYISILNRKTTQLQDSERENESLKEQLAQDPAQERVADLYSALQHANQQNAALLQKLNSQEKETLLQAAKQQVDNLEQELQQQRAEMEREKMELINRTSAQIEMMRDELQTMCQHLQHKERTIHKLVHINREGYVPENDDFKNNAPATDEANSSESRSSSLWSTAIRNGITSLTFARSKFSTPVHTLSDTKKAKTDLAIASSREIDRLRSVIRALSTQQTTSAGASVRSALMNQKSSGKRSGLVDAEYEEVYPGGASN